MQEDWKSKLGALLDTPIQEEAPIQEPVKAEMERQLLRVEMEKRNGKPATIVSGFTWDDVQIKELAKELKVTCGTGGSVRGGEILIQGDMRQKLALFLQQKGHKVKRINF